MTAYPPVELLPEPSDSQASQLAPDVAIYHPELSESPHKIQTIAAISAQVPSDVPLERGNSIVEHSTVMYVFPSCVYASPPCLNGCARDPLLPRQPSHPRQHERMVDRKSVV